MINKLLNNLPGFFSKEPGALLDLLAPIAQELAQAQSGVTSALDQMLLTTASAEWLDEWGGYFGIIRLASEPDVVYGQRLIAELIQPKGNNIAIQNAIGIYLNGLKVTVTDAPMESVTTSLKRDGGSYFDGRKDRQSRTKSFYGQFDINSGYDLTSGESLTDLGSRIKAVVERLRDAGTKLRTLAFTGGLSDAALPGADGSLLYQLQHAPMEDVYRGARPLRDGAVFRGNVQYHLYAGAVARDGHTLRAGRHVSADAPTYGDETDPVSISTDMAWQDDSFTQTVAYGSGYRRDGVMDRRGVVSDGLDDADLVVTKVLPRDGRFLRGSLRDGSLQYSGVSRTFRTAFYSGAISWSESL